MGSYSDSQARASTLYRPQVKLANYHQPEAKPTVQPPAGDTSTLPVIGDKSHETVDLSNFSFPENRPFVSSTDPWALKGSTNIREEMLRYSRQVPKFVSSKADREKPSAQNPLKVAWSNLQQNTSQKITPPTGRSGTREVPDLAYDDTMSTETIKEEQRREKKEEARTPKEGLKSLFMNIVSSLSGGGFNQQPSFT